MSTLRLVSLCTGIGMIDYVWSHLLKQAIAGQVEINPYCQALLAERWPDVPKARDIKEITENDPFGAVDVVAGGIPCQPFSNSGKRRGAGDDRHLWPYAFAIVQRKRPTWVLIGNVAGFISLALDLVQADLESAGYQSRAYVLPACAIGAPHIRERVFILAHTSSCRLEISQRATQLSVQSRASGAQGMAHTYSDRQRNRPDQPQRLAGCRGAANTGTYGTQGTLAHSNGQRCEKYNVTPGNGAQGQRARFVETNRADFQPQSGMGRVLDGLADWMDGTSWPALPGESQYEWEPARTIACKVPYHDARLQALGNTIVPQQVYPFLAFIVAYQQGGQNGNETLLTHPVL
jgi:DNA (cytosine-5)-methyltransferase 1